jgi:hypothetical protein
MDGKIGKMESAFEISMVWKMEAFFGGCSNNVSQY